MKILRCDTCKADIDQDAQHFGADCFEAPQPIDPDNPDAGTFTMLHELGTNEFHFCSPQCLAEWGFARSLASAEPSQ